MEPPTPERTKRELLLEVLVVLLIAWLPYFIGSLIYRASPFPRTLLTESVDLIFDLGSIVLIVYLFRLVREPLRHVGLRRTRGWVEFLWAFAVYCAAWVMLMILAHWGLPGEKPLVQEQKPAGLFAALTPLFLIVSALMEELLFRGYLWHRFRQLSGNRAVAFLATNVLFTIYHPYGVIGLIDVFLFGSLMSLFYLWGRSLPRLVLAHAAYNLAITFEWWGSWGGVRSPESGVREDVIPPCCPPLGDR